MSQFKIFTSIKLLENLNQDDPSNKILSLSILVTNGVSIHSSVVYEQQCYINKTSNNSGIVETTKEQVKTFGVSNKGVSFLLNPDNPIVVTVNGENLEDIFIPENFLFYDDKYLKFLVSQNKIDFTFFETKEPFITLDKSFMDQFFEDIRKVVRNDLFINLKNNDTIELSNL